MITRKEICDNILLQDRLFDKYFYTAKQCKDGRWIVEVWDEDDRGERIIRRYEIDVKTLKNI
ncbi:MAG: hypothetical protein IJ180_08245 [Bacteroidales bacterium]|nr:hypothetical protein [Bacteroidales bacterium]